MMRSLINFLVLLACYPLVFAYEPVKLKDVQVLTLYEGRYTIGQKPIPQLSCRSRLCSKHQPAVVQCQNMGFDGQDYQWKCNANLDKNVKFGKLAVNCEGFSYPNDPYVIAGSCGLEFELLHKDPGSNGSTGDDSNWPFWIFIGVVVIFVMISFCSSSTAPGARSSTPSAPEPPGFRSSAYTSSGPPPAYSEYPKHQGSTYQQQPDSGMGGFWTGLGLGGLGGYMFGRNNTPTYTDYSYYRPSRSSQPSSYQNDCYDSGSSGGGTSYQAEGFGGTKRR